MRMLKALAQGFVKYVLKTGVNAVAGGLPVGDFCVEVWSYYQRDGKTEADVKADLQQVASSPDTRAEIQKVVKETAGDQPAEVQIALELYLEQVPGTIRRSLRSPHDPTGRTVPSHLVLRKALDLRRFLPDGLPRFKPGDQPVPGSDLVLDCLLGTGGFGEVWKARHEDRPGFPPVALKFCTDASAIASLRNEVRLLDRVASLVRSEPGIVQLYNVNLRTEPPFLEYEYVEGGDLGGLILEFHRNGWTTWQHIGQLLFRLATIVGTAHRKDIVHRDLKPDNVLTQRTAADVELKVTDFGIGGVAAGQEIQRWEKTKASSRDDTLDGAFTPIYSSPQQRNGAPASPQDDVYSLGVIWFQAMTGDLTKEPPTGGGWKKRFTEQGMPVPAIELLESCIDADPGDRPASAAVLADRLSTVLHRVALPQQPVPVAAPATVPAAVPVKPPGGATLLIHLPAAGGNRSNDHVEVFLDSKSLGKGSHATGFEFRVETSPGNHTLELEGHLVKRIPIIGIERHTNVMRLVFPLPMEERGEYRATFRYGGLARTVGCTVPTVMDLTYAEKPGALEKPVTKKTHRPKSVVLLRWLVALLVLGMIGGVTAAIVIAVNRSSYSAAGLHWEDTPESRDVRQGQTVSLRLRVDHHSGEWNRPVLIEFQYPQSVLKMEPRLSVEPGVKAIRVPVEVIGGPGEYSISARVAGDSYSSTTTTIRVTGSLK